MKHLTCTLGALSALILMAAPVSANGAPAWADAAAPQADGGQPPGPAPGRGGPRGQRPPLAPEVTETVTRTVKLGPRNVFELATGVGQITLNGTSGDDIRIEAIKRVRHPNPETARGMLANLGVRITERGGLVEAVTEGRGSVDYTISLPMRASVGVKAIGGDIRITNVKGELRVETTNGRVTMSGVGSVRKAKTFAGDVTISDADGEEINADTPGGTLQLRNSRARSVELGSVSGNVFVVDTRCDRCAVKTIKGNVEFVGPLTRNGRYELQSNDGNVRLVPTGNVSFDLEARTFGGKITSEFRLTPDTTAPAREGILRGSYGAEGGAILSLTSFSGNVSIARK